VVGVRNDRYSVPASSRAQRRSSSPTVTRGDHFDAFFRFLLPLVVGAEHVPGRAVDQAEAVGVNAQPTTTNYMLRVERRRKDAGSPEVPSWDPR
jgi:hypothetical protein